MDKVTNWYPAKINPVRVGWYECHYAGEEEYTMRRYWNGLFWLIVPESLPTCCAFGIDPRDKWRGLCAALSVDGK